jgi:long-chain acyl-CoA synthetase
MLTLTATMVRAEQISGNRPAIVDPEGTFTWHQYMDRVRRAVGLLRSLGVERGERFGILSRNSFRQAELIHAGFWMGAIPVPGNFRLAPTELAYIYDNAECKLVAVEDYFEQMIGADELKPWAADPLWIAGPGGKPPGKSYEDLLARAEPLPVAHPRSEEDDAILLYTGGTTGRSKGVRLSHRNVVINGMQTAFAMRPNHDDVYLHVAPMFHSADLFGITYTLAGGAHAFLPQFTGKDTLRTIETLGITQLMLTPTMIIMTLQEPDFERYDLSKLRRIFYGSSPMDAVWIERMVKAYKGVEVVQGYGLTETSPILTMMNHQDHVHAIETGNLDLLRGCGKPIPGVELEIRGGDDKPVPLGTPGEIVVRAPNASTHGYLKRPKETKEAFRGGWFHTGDVARMDEEGNVYLLDRMKDMVITGAENVYTSEVEAALYKHEKIHECAVVGVPDETYGEALLAAVVPAPGATLEPEQLIAHCRKYIGGYKIPRRYVFLDELPKSAMNKILKNELRARYGSKDAEVRKAKAS